MKKTYRMKDLDCANCAAKMERASGKLDGVSAVSVNFRTQKLTLEADEERFEASVEEAGRICRRIEPHCVILGR